MDAEQEAQETLNAALNHAERVLRRNPLPEDATPLMKIAASGQNDPRIYAEILPALTSVSNTLDQQDSDGMTALMYAANRGMGDVLLELLEAGANKTLKNKQGETAADIWNKLPDDMFDDVEVKPFFLNKLQGGRRPRKTKKKSRKARKTKRRTYALRK